MPPRIRAELATGQDIGRLHVPVVRPAARSVCTRAETAGISVELADIESMVGRQRPKIKIRLPPQLDASTAFPRTELTYINADTHDHAYCMIRGDGSPGQQSPGQQQGLAGASADQIASLAGNGQTPAKLAPRRNRLAVGRIPAARKRRALAARAGRASIPRYPRKDPHKCSAINVNRQLMVAVAF